MDSTEELRQELDDLRAQVLAGLEQIAEALDRIERLLSEAGA